MATLRRRNVPSSAAAVSAVKPRFIDHLKHLDIVYEKADEEYVTQTKSGGTVSIISILLCILLFITELRDFNTAHIEERLTVDTRAGNKLPINFNFTFPSLRCSVTHIDVVDKAGDLQLDIEENVVKQRINRQGQWVGEPILEEDDDDSGIGEEEDEGCIIAGTVEVNRVEGNFHVCIGRTEKRSDRVHAHIFKYSQAREFNASHTINLLSFGPRQLQMPSPGHPFSFLNAAHSEDGWSEVPQTAKALSSYEVKPLVRPSASPAASQSPLSSLSNFLAPVEGFDHGTSVRSPLNGHSQSMNVIGHYNYYIKVVPMLFVDETNMDEEGRGGVVIESNTYSFTKHTKLVQAFDHRMTSESVPGLFFKYDLSPFMIEVTLEKTRFMAFVTSCCAIVGGLFAITGLVDSLIYHSQRMIASRARELSESIGEGRRKGEGRKGRAGGRGEEKEELGMKQILASSTATSDSASASSSSSSSASVMSSASASTSSTISSTPPPSSGLFTE